MTEATPSVEAAEAVAGGDGSAAPTGEPPLVQVTDLVKNFPIRSKGVIRRTVGTVQAVSGVTLHINRGETLGLVG